jgi:transglutaminase-like putative cysteine protease
MSPDATRPSVRARPTALRAGNAGPLLLSVSTAVALARLISHGLSARVLVLLMVAIVIADTATVVAVRLRAPLPVAVGLGVVGSGAALLLGVDPSLFDPASHHFLSSGVLSAQFHAAQYALANEGTPLPRLSGVIVGIGAMGGGAAALTRGFWVRRQVTTQSPTGRIGTLAPCMAPSFALFIYSTLVSSDQGRVAAAASYFVGVLLFVAMADRRSSFAASERRARRRRLDFSTVLCCALTLFVVIGAGIGLSGMRLSVFHVTPPKKPAPTVGAASTRGVPQNLLTGIALVDDLRAVELQEAHTVIFRAQSPVATYWQVGTLSTFNGTEWLPTPGVDAALSGESGASSSNLGPAALPSPSPTSLPNFSSDVDITDLYSRLLPAPPHVVSVSGLAGAVAIPEEGVLAPRPSEPGTRYSVTAWLSTTGSVEGPQLATDDPRLTPYLALPRQPAIVSQLAHEAVGDITTPAFQAQALVNWFRSGRFRYTLSPPPTSGPDPLVQFLTVTKAGYCQQFAGAFAVMARALGIPTRLVVGFVAGQSGGGDSFTVTGADAHVWPQVYLGPQAGWVSVEPTPETDVGAATPLGVLEPSTGPQAAGEPTPASPPTTVPGTTPTSTLTTQPAGPGRTASGPARHHATPVRHGSSTVWVLLIGLIALVLLSLIAHKELRRRRALDDTGLTPGQQIVRAWERALLALRRIGLPHRRGETPNEYLARVRDTQRNVLHDIDVDALVELAVLVEQACYTTRPCTPSQAADARHLADTAVPTSHRRRQERVRADREKVKSPSH